MARETPTWKLVCILLVAFGSLLLLRATYEARREYNLGLRYAETAAYTQAIIHLRRSVRWYYPGNPYVTKSLQKLETIGHQSTQSEQTARALSAWMAIHGSLRAVRSIYQPYPQELEQSSIEIAKHLARIDKADLHSEHLSAQRESRLLGVGGEDQKALNILGIFMLLGGACLWISAVFCWISISPTSPGEAGTKSSWKWRGAFGVGWVVFVIGSVLA